MGLRLISEDRRPKDWAYIAKFDKKDLPSLEEMARHIRETHDTKMIEDFNLKCEQKLKESGQSATLDNGLEIKTVAKSDDLVLTAGLRHSINIILGLTSARWTHFGMSADGIPSAAISDTTLSNESLATRVSLAWAEPIGMRLFFGGISSQSSGLRPGSVKEIGVYNSPVAGAVLLNRSTFTNTGNYPKQTVAGITDVSSAPVVVSAVIEFCPVA